MNVFVKLLAVLAVSAAEPANENWTHCVHEITT
jgi:hypothetical protein